SETCTGSCEPTFFLDLEVPHESFGFRFEVAAWPWAPSGYARSEADSSPTGAGRTRRPLLAQREPRSGAVFGAEPSIAYRLKHVEIMALASAIGGKDVPGSGSVQVGAAYRF